MKFVKSDIGTCGTAIEIHHTVIEKKHMSIPEKQSETKTPGEQQAHTSSTTELYPKKSLNIAQCEAPQLALGGSCLADLWAAEMADVR